jgi:5-methylcytosine-specific restriction endonuclease McrA
MKIEDAIRRLMKVGLDNEKFAQVVLLLADVFDEAGDAEQLNRIRESQRVRSARRRAINDVSETEWYQLRAEVFARDGERCAYCGDETGPHHVDHVLPLSKGGKSVLDNLVVACAPCNASKRDKLVADWAGRS